MLLRKNDFLDMAWTKRFIRNILLPVMFLCIAAFCGCARVQEEDDRKTDWKEEREEIENLFTAHMDCFIEKYAITDSYAEKG